MHGTPRSCIPLQSTLRRRRQRVDYPFDTILRAHEHYMRLNSADLSRNLRKPVQFSRRKTLVKPHRTLASAQLGATIALGAAQRQRAAIASGQLLPVPRRQLVHAKPIYCRFELDLDIFLRMKIRWL